MGIAAMGSLFCGTNWSNSAKAGTLALQLCMCFVPTLREYALTDSDAVRRIVLSYLPLSMGSGALGAVLFSTGFPEAYCERMGLTPGTFDVLGCSHNGMHLCVAAAAFFGVKGQRLWEVEQLSRSTTMLRSS